MSREEFLLLLKGDSPSKLARAFLLADTVAAFPQAGSYIAFKARVASLFGGIDEVHLAGSGNWGYSLHPEKSFKAFDRSSDLDVAVISIDHFNSLWEEMRRLHRERWYRLTWQERSVLRRNGENVYAGFVSPLWLPDYKASKRLEFRRTFNELSNRDVDYRPVKAYFFKNFDEAVAYYERGFARAQKEFQ